MASQYEAGLKVLNQLKKSADTLPGFFTYFALLHLKIGNPKKAKQLIQQETSHGELYFEVNLEASIKCGNIRRAKRILIEAKAHQYLIVKLENQ